MALVPARRMQTPSRRDAAASTKGSETKAVATALPRFLDHPHKNSPQLSGGASASGTQRVPRYLHGHVAVSHPNEPGDRAADRGAAPVMRMPQSSEQPPHAASTNAPHKDAGALIAESGSAVARAGVPNGAPLPEDLRTRFASALSTDLTGVRVHTDTESARAAKSVGARAYALGRDIYFGAGQYDPSGTASQRLIAHEVAHTVQQAGQPLVRRDKLEISASGSAVEVEADAVADRLVRGEAASIVSRAAPSIARQEAPESKAEAAEDLAEQQAPFQPGGANQNYTPERWASNYRVRQEGMQAFMRGQYDLGRTAMQGGAASNHGGTKIDLAAQPITALEIITIAQHPGLDEPTKAKLTSMAPAIADAANTSFRVMKLDTLESCAAYLAHASVEGGAMVDYSANKDPNISGNFIGRGALQVTFREGYLKALGALDERALQLQQEITAQIDPAKKEAMRADLETLLTTSKRIKQDPEAAGEDPELAFLFSAGMMHAAGGVKDVAALKGQRDPQFVGDGAVDRWEARTGNFHANKAKAEKEGNKGKATQSQNHIDMGKMKQAAYGRAFDILQTRVVKP